MESRSLRGVNSSTVEEQVEKIWRDVLGMPQEAANATFFELNGQSIAAVRIVTRIEDELGIRVDVGALLQDPDMRAFVRDVASRARSHS